MRPTDIISDETVEKFKNIGNALIVSSVVATIIGIVIGVVLLLPLCKKQPATSPPQNEGVVLQSVCMPYIKMIHIT